MVSILFTTVSFFLLPVIGFFCRLPHWPPSSTIPPARRPNRGHIDGSGGGPPPAVLNRVSLFYCTHLQAVRTWRCPVVVPLLSILFESLLLAAATFALSSKIARALPVFRGRVFLSKRVGGLGHVAIQYAAKFGYTVAAISRGSDKKDHCLELGVRVALGETCTLCYRVRIHSGRVLGVPVEIVERVLPSFLPSFLDLRVSGGITRPPATVFCSPGNSLH